MAAVRMRLHGDIRSGNCYKAALLLHYLALDYEWVAMDVLSGETRSEAFLKLNPVGKIPVLQLDDGRCLSESNAILQYLAWESRYLPRERYANALVQQWLFFEQYSHEPCIATARFIVRFLGNPAHRRDELALKMTAGYRALDLMEQRLAAAPFFAGSEYTIADIALYAYTHVADEAGFELDRYANIRSWMTRIEAQPRHLTMAQAAERIGSTGQGQ